MIRLDRHQPLHPDARVGRSIQLPQRPPKIPHLWPGQTPPPRPPALGASTSACEAHRAWIESQVLLGRNAVSIYQDLVEGHGFAQRYNSVKRFVARLKARAPERFDVLEFLPGEEAQVDYGEGAPTLDHRGKHRKPYLFVMTLKYSGKASGRRCGRPTRRAGRGRSHNDRADAARDGSLKSAGITVLRVKGRDIPSVERIRQLFEGENAASAS
jgi:hypothetical protein